jgi:putative oxygen-independent coproporphyrinogen III oxidase
MLSPSSSPPALTEPDPGFALYVHWPFCQAKCPYCDFNSHVAAQIDHGAWTTAYLFEIERLSVETGHRVLGSIFFGGGTPSLMPPATVAAVIDAARRAWPTVNRPEITLEANPTSVEIGRFHDYRAAGITRVSVGVQALNDDDLRRLGRLHSADEARRAFDAAQQVFDAASFDLIYARQDQTPEAWEAELRSALSLGPSHLSLYQLTIEPGTAFGDRHARGKLPGLPDDDRGADMYDMTQEICADAGLPAYEVSNHARPGTESRHNLVYWRAGDWVGIGPGAHGRLSLDGRRIATEAVRNPATWLASVGSGATTHETRATLAPDDVAAEHMMMGLRLTEGVSMARHAALGGHIDGDRIAHLADLGLVIAEGDRLRATARGRPLLNAILRELLA